MFRAKLDEFLLDLKRAREGNREERATCLRDLEDFSVDWTFENLDAFRTQPLPTKPMQASTEGKDRFADRLYAWVMGKRRTNADNIAKEVWIAFCESHRDRTAREARA